MPVSAEENLAMAHRLAEKVNEAGGKTYYVGGYVRDLLMGNPGKDIDIEVHGIPPEKLAALLDSLGERTVMGASFGIFGLKHYDLDIAMPRKETATGRGHKDFDVFVDPYLGTLKAAMRRDFTVNALMQDILTGEVTDHFGGLRDIKNGILRHVNNTSFAEDPLRVLRAAQFASRLHFTVAPETVALCRDMDLAPLAKERIFAELEKALLKSDSPSVFFQVLREMDQLDQWFPEVRALIGVPQDPIWHPEGDVWNHTMQVLDKAAALHGIGVWPLALMLSALCHDMGKPSVTAETDGRIRSIGHEKAGLPIVSGFLQRISSETKLEKTVLNHVALHMLPNQLASQHAGQKAINRLFDKSLCPEDLLLIAEADRNRKGNRDSADDTEAFLRNALSVYHETVARPGVTGADLVAAGFRPSPAFREALSFAHRLQLAGVRREQALPQTIRYLQKLTQTEKV